MTTVVGLKAARYQMHDEIGKGSMGTVYRAYDRMTGQFVALKEVTTERGTLRFDASDTISDAGDSVSELRVALAREFRTLASLRHPNIINVLDYGFDEGQPYFTMELLQGKENLLDAAKSCSVEQKIYLVAQMLHALVYMHRRGIIHRDLKPDNVMVVNGQVKILDFGLALQKTTGEEAAAGTIAYMAPEVLSGRAASFASDLYAVGMMTYEMLAGHHPFDTSDLSTLLRQTMSAVPDVDKLEVSGELIEALEILLKKEPAERYQDAREVLRIFDEATELSLQSEDASILDSFLQAAEFVGREAETTTLTTTLMDALQYKGSSWLISGESGVGKSRLLDEIRTQALVQGMVVLRGQAVEEASAPYTVWRDPLRALALWTDVQYEEAKILQPLLPDIGKLLHIELGSHEATYSRDKLYEVVENLFRRQKQPTLLILEDLQWGAESIQLLHHLIQVNHNLPLVIMGSYREEEALDLHITLSDMQHIKLERLTETQIADLSASMLGEEIGRNPDIVTLLQHETEGNILFIVEVVRTLAERAGSLDEIAYKTLPEEIFSGSIQTLVQRRIEHLPEKVLDLLQMAAIAGRQLNVELLDQLNPHDYSLNRWLVICSDAAIIEIQDDQWRFSHDKIRTALIAMLEEERKQVIHRKVATTLEAVTKDSGYQSHVLIAYHWENGNEYAMALPHLTKAAKEALRDYASAFVIDYLKQAVYLDAQLKLHNAKAGATKEERAHWERLLGEAMDVDGDHEASKRHYEQLLEILDPDASGTTISNYSKIDKNINNLSREQEDALHACNRLLNLYLYDGEWKKAETTITRMGTIYFGIGDQRNWISTLVTTAWIDYFQGNFSGAEKGFRQSFTIGRLRKLPTMLIAGGAGLVMVTLRRGQPKEQLEKALLDLENALREVSETPDTREKILLDGTRGMVNLALGRNDEARKLAKEGLLFINITRDYQLFDLVAYTSVAETLIELWEVGYTDATLKDDILAASRTLHLFAQIAPIARPRAWMYQARANWLNGEHDRAKRALLTSIMEAQNLHMPYDEGIAYYHLGRLKAKTHSDEAVSHLQVAVDRLESVGAVEQIRKARMILEIITSTQNNL